MFGCTTRRGARSLMAASVMVTSVLGPAALAAGEDPYAALPPVVSLTGVVRDFRERAVPGGHPDMELEPTGGFGHYVGIVADDLDAEGKPAFATTGYRVTAEWRDAAGRNIMPPRPHLGSADGDLPGSMSGTTGGAVMSASSLGRWFRDTPGTNASVTFPISLEREPGTAKYVYDDRLDPRFADVGGFFPINGTLFGNSDGESRNFHFTYELETSFTYERGKGHVFNFTGDDDVWVYVDGKLVIDLGGIHGAIQQSIELDRLAWLADGQSYTLKFFFAERHRTKSNFRIETTLLLRTVQPPAVSGLCD